MTAPSCDLSGCQTQTEREAAVAAWLLALTEHTLFDFERSLRTDGVADGLDEDAIATALEGAREQNAAAMAETFRQFRGICALLGGK